MKPKLPSRRIYKAFINVGIAALLIVLVKFIVSKKEIFFKEPSYQVGQIASKTIVAPFDFFLYQDKDVLQAKKDKVESKVLPHYKISTSVNFDIQDKLNKFFDYFENLMDENVSSQKIHEKLAEKGYDLSLSSSKILENQGPRLRIYRKIISGIETILNKGIITAIPENETIILCSGNIEKEISSHELLTKQKAKQFFIDSNKPVFSNKSYTNLINELFDIFLLENVSFDKEASKKAKKLARASVPQIIGEVLQNELIVQKHQKIIPDISRKLTALNQEKQMRKTKYEEQDDSFLLLIDFLYIYFVLSIFVILFYLFKPEILIKFSLFRCVLIFSIFIGFFVIAIQNIDQISIFLLPVGLPIILLAFLIGAPTAIIFGIVNFFLVSGLLDWQFCNSFIISFSGLGAVIALGNPRSRSDFFQASFYIIIFFVFLNFLLGISQGWVFISMLNNLKWGFFGTIITLLGSMVLLMPIEQRLPVVTNIHLLEVGDFSNKLLKTLSEVASGTYHHSIIVANLAEAAAKSIDANPFLARVGSYYHDIGKTKHPEYFIENLKDEKNIHNDLSSAESAIIVKNHVEDGVKLSKKITCRKISWI